MDPLSRGNPTKKLVIVAIVLLVVLVIVTVFVKKKVVLLDEEGNLLVGCTGLVGCLPKELKSTD